MRSSACWFVKTQNGVEHGSGDFVFLGSFLSLQVVALWDKIDWNWQDGLRGPRAGLQAYVILLLHSIWPDVWKGFDFCSMWVHTLIQSLGPLTQV